MDNASAVINSALPANSSPGDGLSALCMLFELGLHRRLGDALLEAALELLELEVAALEALRHHRSWKWDGGTVSKPLTCSVENIHTIYTHTYTANVSEFRIRTSEKYRTVPGPCIMADQFKMTARMKIVRLPP